MATVLIVEDQSRLRWLYELGIRSMGYRTKGAGNTGEAIGIIESEPVDLIVLDIAMPQDDGLDLLAWLFKHHRSIPIIIHTAFEEYRDHYLCWSAEGYIIKSSDLSELRSEVNRILRSKALTAV